MKLRILTLSLAAVLTGCMSSCQFKGTLPPNSAITGSSGKHVVAVEVSGLTWQQALKKVGLQAAQAGGKLLADYAVATLRAKLEGVPAGTGK